MFTAIQIAKNQTSLQDYLTLYTENRLEMLADKTMPLDAAHEPVAVTWQITFKAIREQHPAGLPLLVSCAYLHADNIPEFLLKALFNQQQPDNANHLKPFIEAIGCLQQYSMLKLITLTGEKAFSVHRLVQEVIFDSLAAERKHSYLKQVSAVLKAVYPYKSTEHIEDYWLQSQLLEHLEALLKRLETYHSKVDEKDLEVIREQDLEQVYLLVLLAHGYGNPHLGNNAQDSGQHQRSALHWAVVKAAIPCIKVLLQEGADIYLQDKAGKSALDYADELPDSTVLTLLLSHRYKLPLENEIDIGKLLRRVAHEGDANIIQKILEKWPDKINEKDQGKTERTALHWAVIKEHVECVKVLLAAGADPLICDEENYSAISRAKKLNHVAINKLFEGINAASSSSSTFTLKPEI